MKKILTLLAIALVGLASCKKEPTKVYSISIDPTELSFAAAGDEETVEVTSSAEWELSGESYWCYASSYSGEGNAEILFSADPNEDSESSRSATFTFISGDKKATLTVTQEKKEYSISIEPKELTFGADGGDQTITVTSSDSWEVKGESDWCDISATTGKNGDKVTFSAAQYTNTEEARTATYTFVCGDKEAELKIEQEAKVYSISVEPTELSFISTGGEKTVTITSSDEWEFLSGEYWIRASERSGGNGASVKIIVDENNDPEIRTGVATFICGDKQADVKITQEAKEFSISIEPTEIEFEADGGEQTIIVTSSDSWRLSVDNDWITTSTKSGENGSLVNIIVGYTTSTEVRTGIITFTCGDKTAKFTVTQNPDNSPIIQFKDPYFLEALLDEDATKPVIDKNGDGQISEYEAKSITKLSLSDSRQAVRNVDELSYFSSIESIDIRGYGKTEDFDLSNHTNLKSVECSRGEFLSLDLSGCSSLTDIQLYRNSDEYNRSLSSLDISGCSSLVSLQTSYNRGARNTKHYEKIIADDCVSLKELKCETKYLSLKNCISLETLLCGGAASLDHLSDCRELKKLDCSPNAAENTASSSLKTLDVSKNTALTYLNCRNNQLTSLDVSNNTALTYLECRYNQLTSLDVSNNTTLTTLYCSDNQLTSLDVSNNTALTDLDCDDNQLTSLEVSNNTALTDLDCGDNQLTTLDMSNNTALGYLDCNYNQLIALDVSNCKALTELYCHKNQLTSLNLGSCVSLIKLECHSNNITLLDVSMCRYLKRLFCIGTNILGIDSSTKLPLESLRIYKYHIIDNNDMSLIEEFYGDIIEYVE